MVEVPYFYILSNDCLTRIYILFVHTDFKDIDDCHFNQLNPCIWRIILIFIVRVRLVW